MTTITDNLKKKYTELSLLNDNEIGTAGHTVNSEAAKLAEISAALTAASITPTVNAYPAGTAIMTSATGDGSSDVFDFGDDGDGYNIREAALVRITTTIGSTPTCTFAIQGSVDGTNFTALKYSDSATPKTLSSSTFDLTTATTVVKIVQAGQVWRYLKVVRSSNTNVTVGSSDVLPLGGNLSAVSAS